METVHRATLGHGAKLLMVGSSSSTYRLAELIIKITRIDDDAAITQANAKAMAIEANVYSILGNHDRIANFIYISPLRDMILLQFYVNGNLKQYVESHGPTQLRKWARQMIEAVEIIHGKGVRHPDIRLDQ
jgi:serine/threonine protein kinase